MDEQQRDQGWFWRSDWQAGEAEADRDLAEGRFTRTSSEHELASLIDG